METAIILPTFKEENSVYQLLLDLLGQFGETVLYVIVDDSPDSISSIFAENAFRKMDVSTGCYEIISRSIKQGRGDAVLHGFQYAFEKKKIIKFVEMDSDGSHQPKDVRKVIQEIDFANVVLGSRYLPDSKIIGWPASRRTFSRFLNLIIPKMFGLDVSDCTNGLRGYDRLAISVLLKHTPTNKGFIFLTESLIALRNEVIIKEIPIIFKDRISGNSTVGFKELRNSINGILRMYFFEKAKK